jgi:hypothetical protein
MKNEVKTMELGKKKNQAIIAFVLILTMTALMVVIPAGAQLPDEIPTFLMLNVAPNPVGQGQDLYINAFMTKPAVTAEVGGGGIRYEDITIEMTKPDGSTHTFGPLRGDPTGGTWSTWAPDQLGEYTFQAFYPGQHIEATVASMFGPTTTYDFWYTASESEVITVTVQEEQVEWIYHSPGLPEEYWTRPIYATNWAWADLGGHWYGLGVPAFATTGGYDATGNFNPYSEAPDSPHIVWSKSTHIGGQPGLPIPGDQEHQYMSTTITKNFFEPTILNGVLYYSKKAGPGGTNTAWEAVDIRTGEVLWSRSAGESGSENIRMVQAVAYHTMQEYGSWAHLYGTTGGGFFGGAGDLHIYDAFTGEYLAEITGAQSPSYIVSDGPNMPGSLLGYYTSGSNLIMWNSSKLTGGTGVGYDITYGVSGSYAWADGIQWSVPLPTQLNGIPISLSLNVVTRDILLVVQRPTPGMWISLSYGYQIAAGYNATTGEKIWGPINQTIPALEDISNVAAGDGVYVLHNKDKNEAWGFSLENGENLWGPVKLDGNAWSTISRSGDVAYGLCYIWDIGGWVNAINLTTGDIEWSFNRGSAGYDTPFGVYPLWYNDAIADGKIYLSEGTMYTPPLHPARTICLNATSGELIWSILSYTGRVPPAIADGHMIVWNSFDMKIYSFGKGPTETTATVQNDIISLDSTALVKGSVMDISAGAKQDGVVERFPNGIPAVADEDMKEWMEYVYMQQKHPRDVLGRDVTGVTVKITSMDPNNNTKDYGTVTTDAHGNYVFEFEPEVPGMYQLIVTFEGSDSYWRSSATTYVKVGPAAEEAPSAEDIAETTVGRLPAYPEIPAYLTIDLVILILAAIGVVIGLIAYMALRKLK